MNDCQTELLSKVVGKLGFLTAKDGRWHVSSIHRLLKRLDGIEQQEKAA
jgi:hypothetical protein